MSDGLPDWVQDEIINWSRWCWLGEWPHPLPPTRCGSGEGGCLSSPDWGDPDDPPPPIRPINHDRAKQVQRLYEVLPLIEQRIVQAEYTRRNEYGEMRTHERHAAASVRLRISVAYYRQTLERFRQRVWREFL